VNTYLSRVHIASFLKFVSRSSYLTGGWVVGWMGGWMDVKAVLRIAYSNQKAQK
jgi:hypothetical protein